MYVEVVQLKTVDMKLLIDQSEIWERGRNRERGRMKKGMFFHVSNYRHMGAPLITQTSEILLQGQC